MLNLNELNGVESSPISSSVLENSIGNLQQKDSMAFSNYEFMVDLLKGAGFKPPSVVFASGDGTVYPKTASYQNQFYSANIFGRDGYLNSWQASYRIDESYELTYFDGNTLFRGLRIEPSTGRVKGRSLETRNGNPNNGLGLVQYLMGYNGTAAIDDVGYYRHNFRTRHSASDNALNALDIYLWDKNSDGIEDVGSRRVVSMYGNGSFEVVEGSIVLGELDVDVSSTAAKTAEQNTLAIAGKGVIYFNKGKGKFRYSENGGPFKYLGSGGGSGGVALETCSLNKCQLVNTPKFEGNKYNTFSKYAFVVRLYSPVKAKIKKIYIPSTGGSMQIAVYSPEVDMYSPSGSFRYTTERILAYCQNYGGINNSAQSPFYFNGSVELDNGNWDFFDRWVPVPNEALDEAVVSGSFSIAITLNPDSDYNINSIMGELLPMRSSPDSLTDNLTQNGSNGMNFEIKTYDSSLDTNPTTTGSNQYTQQANKFYRVSTAIDASNFSEQLNFVPYVKVVLEEIEE